MQQNNSSSKNPWTTALTFAAITLIGSQLLFSEEAPATAFTESAAAISLGQTPPATATPNRKSWLSAVTMPDDGRLAPQVNGPAPAVREQVLESSVTAPDKTEAASEFNQATSAMEDTFWSEIYDGEWTANLESELLDTLERRSISNTTLDIVQCHDSICLVEFFHDTEQAQEMMMHHISAIRPYIGGFMAKRDDSGSDIRTLVYFARPGQTLPLPFNLLTSV